jgi:phosphopantothenate-cysteine ligase/phosphopantothenoylcysteine decarboxylase/phosphopantothenate--cysteine ligase
MNLLVTAGNTQAPIDRVRCVTNIFTGRTGAHLALTAWQRGHRVTLLTSHPEVAANPDADARWLVRPYRTFDDLAALMETEVRRGDLDGVFHAAAVSDYLFAGVYSRDPGTTFANGRWIGAEPRMIDHTAVGKVKSDLPELWLRLVRAPKLVDRIREPWGFSKLLVKFKLEVGKTEAELERIAEQSRLQSRADYMVANTLEGAADWALVGPIAGEYEHIPRGELSRRLVDLAEGR